MKRFLNQFRNRLLQVAMVAIACALLVFNAATPALAFGGASSRTSDGTAQMNNLQKTSERAVKSEPRSRSRVQAKARRGPNEVQGDADLHGMNVPDNSKETTTVRKQAEEALKKVTPGDR